MFSRWMHFDGNLNNLKFCTLNLNVSVSNCSAKRIFVLMERIKSETLKSLLNFLIESFKYQWEIVSVSARFFIKIILNDYKNKRNMKY